VRSLVPGFPVFKPINSDLKVLLHIGLFFIPELKNDLFRIAFIDLITSDLHDFALYVFIDLMLRIASLIKSIIKLSIVTSKKNDKIKPSERKHSTRMEIENVAFILLDSFKEINDLVIIEYRDIIFVVPFSIQFVAMDRFTYIVIG